MAYDYNIGYRIRTQRICKGITQKQLSEDLGISISSVSMYEAGNRRPEYEVLVKLADYFGVSTDYMIKGTLAERTQSDIFSSLNLEDSTNVDKVFVDLLSKHKELGVRFEQFRHLSNKDKVSFIHLLNGEFTTREFDTLFNKVMKRRAKKE